MDPQCLKARPHRATGTAGAAALCGAAHGAAMRAVASALCCRATCNVIAKLAMPCQDASFAPAEHQNGATFVCGLAR